MTARDAPSLYVVGRSTKASVRELFAELVGLSAEHRLERIAALGLAHADAERLEAMLVFDDIAGLDDHALADSKVIERLSDGVKERVVAMLAANTRVPQGLRDGAQYALGCLKDEDDEIFGRSLIGTTIGTFVLQELLGHGGSSVVFRATRQAGEGSQQVALKLLRAGLYSGDAQRQFRREQAILAQLTHPDIATLIEGGVSASGIPYIAMELVEGLPITQAADARCLGLQDRLRWISRLCRTIDSAHASLVVHRDLKPSNIFITHDGNLKILDFGIAKLVESDDVTQTQSVSFTRGYAAPEQLKRGPLTTAVDVFALGVVLGELLTGLRLGEGALASAALIAHKEASLPSGLPGRHILSRQLRGDIDAIVATALAVEPELRYRSAGQMADDIDRYLTGRPVRAHPPSTLYRLRKFCARHRASIAIACVLLIGMMVSLAAAIWQAVEVQRAAILAQNQAARADSMRNFIFETFSAAEPAHPRDGPVTLNEVIDRAILTTTNDRSIDARARLELLARLAQVVGAQGNVPRSGALLEDAYDQAIKVVGKDDPLALELARLLANNHLLAGGYEAARAEVDDLLQRVPAAMRELRIGLLHDSDVISLVARDYERAKTDATTAVQLATELGKGDFLRAALGDLGNTLVQAGEIKAALPVLERMSALTREQFGTQSEQYAEALADSSRAYRRAGQLALAEDSAKKAVAIGREIYKEGHWKLSNFLNALGQTLVARRNFDGALEAYEQSQHISEATRGAGHPETAVTNQALAFVQMQLERYEEALPHLKAAIEADIVAFGESAWQTAYVQSDYGFALAKSGKISEGVALMDESISGLERLTRPDHHALARALERRIRFALERGNVSAAMQRIEELDAESKKVVEQATYWVGKVDCLRGEIAIKRGQPNLALDYFDRCGAALDTIDNPDKVLYVSQRFLAAGAARAMGDEPRAATLSVEGTKRFDNLSYPPKWLVAMAAETGRGLPK